MDYYETLGVPRGASQSEIRQAYRKLSKQYHPDRHKGDKKAEEKYKQINRAYECLSDQKKKQAYDQFGSEDGPQFGGGGSPFGHGFQGFEGFSTGGFGDIFETFFGGARGTARRASDVQGRDVEVTVTVSLADAFSGGRKTIRLKKRITCGECSGTGASKGSKKVSCGECNGTGQVTRTAQSFFGTIQQSMMCDRCEGSGRVPESPCGACGGEGRVVGTEDVRVDIPVGISHGQTLRLRGKGEAGRQGAAAGDLYVAVAVQSDARFVREGDDLRAEVSIAVPDAVLGTEIPVATFDGTVTVKAPPGTQPGQVLRLKGKGMPVLNASRRGDLYVRVIVEVPKKVGRRERKLWDELRGH